MNECRSHIVDDSTLNSKRVLVDGNDSRVLQDFLVLGSNVAQVVGHEKGGCENGPHCHLQLALVQTQSIIANEQLQCTQII